MHLVLNQGSENQTRETTPKRVVLVSYRGPNAAGGVSSSFSRLHSLHCDELTRWFYVGKSSLDGALESPNIRGIHKNVPQQLLEAHYNFSNNFLWPLMHDLPDLIHYRRREHLAFRFVNETLSKVLLASEERNFFVQDYQLSLTPALLKRDEASSVKLFWHIPWPKLVPTRWMPVLVEVVSSLLHCDILGFHTQEYVNNFERFVATYLPGVAEPTYMVAPLGLDNDSWSQAALKGKLKSKHSELGNRTIDQKYVLSVDRADYTKGVLERLEAIRIFFKLYPSMKESVTFIQVCGRTRPGLQEFDEYWTRCLQAADLIEKEIATDSWSPLVWLQEPVDTEQLVELYRSASVMVVTPIRDGLNLTAKEFSACLDEEEPGVLMLSPGAGVFQELGKYAVKVDPKEPFEFAHTIWRSLNMPLEEKKLRAEALKQSVANNSLTDWWRRFNKRISVKDIASKAVGGLAL